jgi:hypothetical protein
LNADLVPAKAATRVVKLPWKPGKKCRSRVRPQRATAGVAGVEGEQRGAMFGGEIHQSHQPSIAFGVVDSVSCYVLWEQTFDGDEWQWVRFDKALPAEQAEEVFNHLSRIALAHSHRRVQIRHGHDEVVKEWTAPEHGRR